MTSTEKIKQDLLDAVGDPATLEMVFRRNSHSKGPLYNALAAATEELRHQIKSVHGEIERAKAQRDQVQQQVAFLEAQRQELETIVEEAGQQVSEAQSKLGQLQSVLDRVDELARRGFGEAEFARLADILGSVAASQGAPPEEGVAQFFQTVARYEHVVSLDLEATRAEVKAAQARAEAERWEAEARNREAHSKARMATIDTVEAMLTRGVKEEDLPQWVKILERAGVAPPALAQALEEYASVEELCRQRERRAEELEEQVGESEARIKALRQEQARVRGALKAIRDGALGEIERMGREARKHLAELLARAKDYGELQRAAAQFEGELALARALRGQKPDSWTEVPLPAVQQMMRGLVLWAHTTKRYQPVAPPVFIRQSTTVSKYERVSVHALLLWAFYGTLTEAEREALEAGK